MFYLVPIKPKCQLRCASGWLRIYSNPNACTIEINNPTLAFTLFLSIYRIVLCHESSIRL